MDSKKPHHYILSPARALMTGMSLLVLTAITVWVSQVDLGHLNFPIAMLVASLKAALVIFIFMDMRHDKTQNRFIFFGSFLFLAIFLTLVSSDLFFRGNVYVQPAVAVADGAGGGKVKKAWIATPRLIAKGKEIFSIQCVACHGASGEGNGVAAAALNPRPRNFHALEGWKNGRKPTMIFKTLKEGIAGGAMASYATLPAADRWALAHFVVTWNPTPPEADTPNDFQKIGIDPNKEEVVVGEVRTLSVVIALQQATVPDVEPLFEVDQTSVLNEPRVSVALRASLSRVERGQKIYQQSCVQCHGLRGQGGMKAQALLGYPAAYVMTSPLLLKSPVFASPKAFQKVLSQGMPGRLMPARADLSVTEAEDLEAYLRVVLEQAEADTQTVASSASVSEPR